MAARRFKKGQIVRYGDGATALCRLAEPHTSTSDGWHATQFHGDVCFVRECDMTPASAADVKSFVEEQRSRKARQ